MTKGEMIRYERWERRKRKRRKKITFIIIAVAIFICMAVSAAYLYLTGFGRKAIIQITTDDQEMYEGDEMPPLLIRVESETAKYNKLIRLGKGADFTAEELVGQLQKGEGVSLECDADTHLEGTYPIRVKLSDELKKKIEDDWGNKAQITVKDGVLTVKNRIGEWDGDRFRKYDGTYVTNDFVTYQNKKYYFDEEGNKVTGWRKIGDYKFYFGQEGIMEADTWEQGEDGRFYLDQEGHALTGWQEMNGNRYFFDQEGIMAVGDVKMGVSTYSFDQEGKLLSVKNDTVDPSKPMVALTFDDGPGKRTGEILDQLEKYGAHATFFMLGQNVPSYPSVVERMKELGCELGNHSYDHPELTKLSGGDISSQVDRTNKKIMAAAGVNATVMRPPYGSVNSTVSANVGMPMILWNIDTLDWKTRNAQKTIDIVMKTAKDGDIILMHDIHTESVDAALVLIPKLQEAGFQLVTVSEMAAAKNVSLAAGKTYTDF